MAIYSSGYSFVCLFNRNAKPTITCNRPFSIWNDATSKLIVITHICVVGILQFHTLGVLMPANRHNPKFTTKMIHALGGLFMREIRWSRVLICTHSSDVKYSQMAARLKLIFSQCHSVSQLWSCIALWWLWRRCYM